MNRNPRIPVLILAALLVAQAGCGGRTSTTATEQSPRHVELREVGEMYRTFVDDNKRPAQAVKDLMKYASAFDFGAMALQERRVLVAWGVGLEPGSKGILAYQKEAPEAGGLVLLRDGATVLPMTAQEVQSATQGGARRPD